MLSPRRATRDMSSALHADLRENLQSVQVEIVYIGHNTNLFPPFKLKYMLSYAYCYV